MPVKRKIRLTDDPQIQAIPFKTEEEWLVARRSYITGSDAACILGQSPYKSALELYLEKTGQTPFRETPSEKRLESMEWGKILEEPVVQKYEEKTKRKCIDPGRFTLHINRSKSIAAVTLDRIIEPLIKAEVPEDNLLLGKGMGALECKSSGAWAADQWEDSPPLHHVIQLQHAMMVMNFNWGSLAAIIGGQQFAFRCRDIPASQAFLATLWNYEQEFMENVKNRKPPAPDFSESASKCIGKLFPKETGATVQLGDEYIDLIHQWEERKAALSVIEKEKKELDNKIKVAIGSNSFAVLPDGTRLSYLTQDRAGFFVQPTSFRVLRKQSSK